MTEERPKKKKVVYLLGAGASDAEIRYLDPRCKGILMQDVVGDIPSKLDESTEDFKRIKAILVDDEKIIDIEQIITLYEHDVDKKHHVAANKLRELFRKIVTSRIVQVLSVQPKDDGYVFHSSLLAALFDMHTIDDFDEELCAVLTTNYDDLVERALQNVYGGFDYTFELVNKTGEYNTGKGKPLLKLHGSFNWIGEYPIELDKPANSAVEDFSGNYIIWAPPGLIKQKSNYPFSAIWSKARELLDCDILRIVGCSLSRNDWLLIELIHDAQKLRKASHLKIQLLDYPGPAYYVWKNFPYLDVEYILFKDYFSSYCHDIESIEIPDRTFASYSDEDIEALGQQIGGNTNMFQLWLAAIGYEIKNTMKLNLGTERNIFKRFCEKEEAK
jgi:hypothetical protein